MPYFNAKEFKFYIIFFNLKSFNKCFQWQKQKQIQMIRKMEKGCNDEMLDVSELTQTALIGQGMRKIVNSH